MDELLRDRFNQVLRGILKGDDDAHEVIVDELISLGKRSTRGDQ
jgi:hypothetical protein